MEYSSSFVDPALRQVKSTKRLIKEKPLESGYHGKIDWDVAKRFLHAIYESGRINKTNLAMKAGVNYGACGRYVKWMEEVNWIVHVEGSRIKLSDAGLLMHERLQSLLVVPEIIE
jgi:predicted transcriptional regulator